MTKTKTKPCQNCKSKFTIEPADFDFYKKIDVPEPTFCPECRMQRRMAFRDERKLYKRKDDFANKEIISVYHPDAPYRVYTKEVWWSDKWDPMKYGRDYDFNKPFFEQFDELMREVPRQNLRVTASTNCSYCNGILESKNCYLASGYRAEDCFYIESAMITKDSLDSSFLLKVERGYESIDCNDSYNISFCTYCNNCIDSAFLYDCHNCQNCFGCVNLRNKKYHIFNQPYTKAEYNQEIEKYDLGNYRTLLKIKQKFKEFNLTIPKAWAKIAKSVNTTGDNVQYSKNCQNCFWIREGAEDCKYLFVGGLLLKDSHDIYAGGAKSELSYESNGILGAKNVLFSDQVHRSFDTVYSTNCFDSSNLFGCIGLRHKQYCILNKQYSKKEYAKMVKKIKNHIDRMPYEDKKGRLYKYGEFFPAELSPFGYNETIANEYFPLTKKQAIEQGFNWYDKPKSEHRPTIKAKDLPDNIKDVDESILKEVIECANAKSGVPAGVPALAGDKGSLPKGRTPESCAGSGVFRLIPQELKFYQKMNLPLPRLCPDCRHQERIKQRNPLKLWKRKCMNLSADEAGKPCPNTFQTTYAPDRKEIVYCEQCYLKEVG